MQKQNGFERDRPTQDLFLLLSLLLLILIHPQIGKSDWHKLVFGLLCVVPLIVATLKIAHHKKLVAVLVALITIGFGAAAMAQFHQAYAWSIIQWTALTLGFGLTVATL